ncbi:MAG: 3-hydroxybutyryl-CoA dehydrogenase, partial [bacterium]|nr:3-hydroxybutyryl-CoA dehydrogenase [Candidatus Kapabacteria bacterium]
MSSSRTFGVCGAGTMGSGIAYAAAAAGYDVWLYDIADEMLERGRSSVSA